MTVPPCSGVRYCFVLARAENNTAFLGQAEQAGRKALEVFNRQDTPEPWAEAWMNIGDALLARAEKTVSIRNQAAEALAEARGAGEAYQQAAQVYWQVQSERPEILQRLTRVRQVITAVHDQVH